MSTLPPCPPCREDYTDEDGPWCMCPSRGHGPMQLKTEFVKKA